ncbi:MAG TPA: hypothetical protein VGF38_02230 [Ktedonobacterales bacterium]|jgi:hypothetical protein
MVYVIVIFVAVLPAGLVALAVGLDRRMRRGYGLGLLAAMTLALDSWGAVAVAQATQRTETLHTDNLAFAFGVAIILLIGLYLTLVLALGGVAEAVIARHLRWLVLLVAVDVVTAVVILTPATGLGPDILGAFGLSRGAEFLLLLVLPVLVILAYAITRMLRSVDPLDSPGPTRDRVLHDC